MNYGKRRLFFLTEQQIKEGWIPTRHMPDRRLRRRFTVKQWAKFDIEKQMYLTKIFHIILTDHKTTHEKILGTLKAIIRPTPAQRKNQKQKLDHSIEKFQKGIDRFGEAMDELDRGLKAGRPDTDPVELVFGKRTPGKEPKKKKPWTANPETVIMGNVDKDKYKALTG